MCPWPSLLKISIYWAHHLHPVTTWCLLCNLCHLSVAVDRNTIRIGWWKTFYLAQSTQIKYSVKNISLSEISLSDIIQKRQTKQNLSTWAEQVLGKYTRNGWYTEGKRKVLGFHVTANAVSFSAISRLPMSCFHTKLCWWMCEGIIHGQVSACASFLKFRNPD